MPCVSKPGWNLLELRQESTKLSLFQCQSWVTPPWIWGALWDGRHTQLVWDRGDPKSLSQMLASHVPTNLLTLNSTQGGQSCRLWKPTASRAFPGKAPYHETAQSSHQLYNPTKQEENQDFTGGTNRSLLPGFCRLQGSKGWFSTSSDLQITRVLGAAQTGLSHLTTPLNQDFKTKQKNPAKAKDFFKLEQIKQTLSKEELFWYSSWRLFLAQHQRLGL